MSGVGQTIRRGGTPSGIVDREMVEMVAVVECLREDGGMMLLAQQACIHSFVNWSTQH